MKIIVAPDKYKGSLSSLEICSIVKEEMEKLLNVEVVLLPMADGGDGTIEVVNYYLKGEIVTVEVNDPVFRPVKATYLFSHTTQKAFIELAEASGIKLLEEREQNCKYTSTYGTGELILDAINKGAKHIILGLGGSATNDCGIGMASALGYRFLDKRGKSIKPVGEQLINIVDIDDSKVNPYLDNISIQIACDVTNPLYGSQGAAMIYARQKGASDREIKALDEGLRSFSKLLDNHFKIESQSIEGAGAAGGMGAGAVAFLDGELKPGIDLIKQIAKFDECITGGEWIITGEGKLDNQTLSGKAIDGILKSARNHNISVATFCGSIDLNENQLNKMGIKYSASILEQAKDLDDAINNSKRYLKNLVSDFVNYIQ